MVRRGSARGGRTLTLHELLSGVAGVAMTVSDRIEVAGISYDSRRVRPGEVFFALPGARHDGLAFVAEAVARGAAAVVSALPVEAPVPVVRVPEPRAALAHAACWFYGNPSREMRVVGVTGTNGKTTVTYLLEGVFHRAGWLPGLIGTTGVHVGDAIEPSAFTTPEAPELQALLRTMVDRGVRAVAIEVSSHALVQSRSRGLDCDVAVFTNLTHDHLDFHGTLERYLDAKLMLFDGRNAPDQPKPLHAVINLDDDHAAEVLAAAKRGGATVWTYGEHPEARVRIDSLAVDADGLRFDLIESARPLSIRFERLGRFNAWNAAAAYASARALGLDPATASEGLIHAPAVPGRLERVHEGQAFEAVVDYAHTPDALHRALAAVREHARGRVLAVFGCGGDRDRAKRPHMGSEAELGADEVWVTNDNPRSEDPLAIAAEILAGMKSVPHVVLDRREAIAEALAAAQPGDVVLVAGKGHETTQTIGDQILPFDDREVVRGLLRQRRGTGR